MEQQSPNRTESYRIEKYEIVNPIEPSIENVKKGDLIDKLKD